MKVILLQDVAKIGRRSEIVEVPDGYALNQLIPKRMAEPATTTNMKRVEQVNAIIEADKAAEVRKYEVAGESLKEHKIQIFVEANEQGHLFKAVSEVDIAKAAQKAGIEINEAMVRTSTPIKSVGEHVVQLVNGKNTTEFTIEVINNK